jgi:toxin-antitoxin system PIN domain toxin
VGAFLLDANVLIALAWPEHEAHTRVGRWFSNHSRAGWATCPITQSALVRILSNPAFSPAALSVSNALSVLEANVKLPEHHFWPDDIPLLEAVSKVGKRVMGHQQVTDLYLMGLAVRHRGKLATMDRGGAAFGPQEVIELIP